MTTVLAGCEQRDGSLRKVSSEVVTGARRIADALGAEVEALVLGSGPANGADQLGGFGADRVVTLTADGFGSYAPEGYAKAVADRAKGAAVVVCAASAQGKDLAPRIAAKLGTGLAADVTDVTVEGGALVAIRPVYAGKALLKVKLTGKPAVLSLRPNVFTPVQRPKAGTASTRSEERRVGKGGDT